MTTTLVLNCWVFGDDPGDIFRVEISATDTVIDLKAKIKEEIKPALDHVPVNELDLFEASIPFDGHLKENLNNFTLHGRDPLLPLMMLSSIFAATKNQLVVVRACIRLNCCVLSPDHFDSSHIFSVQVSYRQTVYDLKEAIKYKYKPAFDHIPAHDLTLWKVSFPVNGSLQEHLSQHGFVDEGSLSPLKQLLDVFSEPPVQEHFHIVIKLPSVGECEQLAVTTTLMSVVFVPPDLTPENDSVNEVPDRGTKRRRGELDDLITERKRLAKMAKCAPDSLSRPSNFQTLAQQVVACNRPFDPDTIPITLLQEEFGLFMDDCKVLPSPKSQELLQALTVAACKWHENETKRRSEIQKVFHNVAGLYLSAETIAGTEYKTDGNLRVNIMPPVIRKCKNKARCALLEAIAYYVQFLGKVLDRRGMRNCFPCILLIDTGSYFGLYGCLWTGEHLHVEPLTPLYDLTTHWTDESGRQAIAASLDALLKAIPRLEAHYAQLASIAPIPFPGPSLLDRAYPYKTSYEDENGQHINFSYRLRIGENLVFVAKPDKSSDKDLDTLCIKFTRWYSEDAHRFLAHLGYAPRLRAVMRLPGGWNMVVMDYSEYTQLCAMLQISDELRHTIMAKVSEVVQKLHDAGFVHGDIRSANILVDCRTLTSKDGIKIHFIDFDWAGRQGEAVYPMRVNNVTVWRPEGASDGKPILVEHDMAMVNYLL